MPRRKITKFSGSGSTTFSVGDKVISRINQQGLVAGGLYTVVDIKTYSTPFGGFTTYVIESGGKKFQVRNGHLVLDKAGKK